MHAPVPPSGKPNVSRFSYIKYDQQSSDLQQALKAKFEEIEHILLTHLSPSREQSACLTQLEVAYMWTGKAIRNDQILRGGDSSEQVERSAE